MPLEKPTLLLILDGFGVAAPSPGNAVTVAGTPNIDAHAKDRPRTTLACSGRAVGLPDGFMGNSEVGHMNIGSGRVVYQDMTRIDIDVEQDKLGGNQALCGLIDKVGESGGALHFMGLLSDGGVHSHINHLKALLEVCKAKGVSKVFVHAFMDGRDTPPHSGKGYLEELVSFMNAAGLGRIATVTGRFYAMDRDKRWERVAEAYAMLTSGKGRAAADPIEAVAQSYEADETDEFVKPRVVVENNEPVGLIRDGDGVFFFNFRADRAREITSAFIKPDFDAFEREAAPRLAGFVSMTRYESDFDRSEEPCRERVCLYV